MATELIDVAALKARFDIHTSVKDERLKPGIRAAARRLKVWIGATLYAQVIVDAANYAGLTEDGKARVDDLKDAEAYLAMHFLILGLQTQVRAQGLVAEEKLAEGATVIRLLNPQATAQMIELYLQQAEEMAKPYKVDVIASSFEFGLIENEIEASDG